MSALGVFLVSCKVLPELAEHINSSAKNSRSASPTEPYIYNVSDFLKYLLSFLVTVFRYEKTDNCSGN